LLFGYFLFFDHVITKGSALYQALLLYKGSQTKAKIMMGLISQFRRLLRDPKALVAGWHSTENCFVLWLQSRGQSLALHQIDTRLTEQHSKEVVAGIRSLGADQVLALRFPSNGLNSLAGTGGSFTVRDIIETAVIARNRATPVTVETVTFELPVAGRNLRDNEPISAPWNGSVARLAGRDRCLLLAALPTNVVPQAERTAWKREVASLCLASDLLILPCWIADWGAAVPLAPSDLHKLVQSKAPATPTMAWHRMRICTSAREVDADSLSQALDRTREAAISSKPPTREEFATASPASLAFFAQSELVAARNRASRYLDIVHLTLGNLHYTILPGPPIEALARRLLTRIGEHKDVQLVCQCAGGGVLSAWALYRANDYETQAAFQPHSIGTGDYLVKACNQLAGKAVS